MALAWRPAWRLRRQQSSRPLALAKWLPLAAITDANGNRTAYLYDGFNRLERTTYDDLSFERTVYDKAGNVAGQWTTAGEGIQYAYDALNRVTAKYYLPDDVNAVATFTYDAGSRLTDADNAEAQLHYEYDALNRVSQAGQVTAAGTAATGYTYWKNGAVKSLTYPGGRVVDYTYDANNNLDLVRVGGATLTDYDYDVLDRRSLKTYPGVGQQTGYTFDIAGQLKYLQHQLLPATNIARYQYPQYDGVGNRKQMTRTFGADLPETTDYTYNVSMAI